VGALYVITFQ